MIVKIVWEIMIVNCLEKIIVGKEKQKSKKIKGIEQWHGVH